VNRRLLHVPARFDVYSNLDATGAALVTAIERHCEGKPHIGVLSGDSHTANAATAIQAKLAESGLCCSHAVLREASLRQVREATGALRGRASALLAVGGGSVIDVAKLVASELELPLLIVPTALSSDCIGSPVAVTMDDAGRKQSLPSVIPSQVVVDTSITLTAPREMALSGVCDVLSNASAVLDAAEAQRCAGYIPDNFSIALSESAFHLLLPVAWDSFATAAGHQILCKSLILSGLAMGFSGDSVPCSGAEHAISHALDHLQPSVRLHGLQVGVTTRFCHHLRLILDKPGLPPPVIEALEALDLLQPPALGLSRELFLEAAELGTAIRPGRYTILNQVPDRAVLAEAYARAFP
jgi:glycerol-1-phosphate dehydrogenase [NAD(P)+]